MSSSVKVSPCNSTIIDITSFHLKSAQLSAMKNVGKPNCITMVIYIIFAWKRLDCFREIIVSMPALIAVAYLTKHRKCTEHLKQTIMKNLAGVG